MQVLQITVLFSLAWWFVRQAWRDYCVDRYRQELFELRGELFMLAAKKKIQFNDTAYKALRGQLNNSIRFAHRTGILHFTFGAYVLGLHNLEQKAAAYQGAWDKVLELQPEEVRREIKSIRKRAAKAVLKKITSSSITWRAVSIAVMVIRSVVWLLDVCHPKRLAKPFASLNDWIVTRAFGVEGNLPDFNKVHLSGYQHVSYRLDGQSLIFMR